MADFEEDFENDLPDGFDAVTDVDPDETKLIGYYRTEEEGERIRVVAHYSRPRQVWTIRREVRRGGEWKTSLGGRQLEQFGPDDDPQKIRYLNRYVKSNQAMFTGLSLPMRILTAPLYAFWIAKACILGADINVQYLHDEGWEPGDE